MDITPEKVAVLYGVTKLATAAATKFVEQIAEKGADGLWSLLKRDSPKLKENIRDNVHDLIERLIPRIEALEKTVSPERFQELMDNPAVAMSLQKAAVSAAATSRKDIHEVLAELIAKRLTAEEDDLVALAAQHSCEILANVSAAQIHYLGILFRVRVMRRNAVILADRQESYERDWAQFWAPMDHLLTPESLRATTEDVEHLQSLGCITMAGIGHPPGMFVIHSEPFQGQSNRPLLEQQSWWKKFETILNLFRSAQPLSVGKLIGQLHQDSIVKDR